MSERGEYLDYCGVYAWTSIGVIIAYSVDPLVGGFFVCALLWAFHVKSEYSILSLIFFIQVMEIGKLVSGWALVRSNDWYRINKF